MILKNMFECIHSLVDAGRDLTLDFGFAHLYFRNKNMSYKFKETEFMLDNFGKDTYSENLTSAIWKNDYQESFKNSATGIVNKATDIDKLKKSISQKRSL
jgi:hypothetical protein